MLFHIYKISSIALKKHSQPYLTLNNVSTLRLPWGKLLNNSNARCFTSSIMYKRAVPPWGSTHIYAIRRREMIMDLTPT